MVGRRSALGALRGAPQRAILPDQGTGVCGRRGPRAFAGPGTPRANRRSRMGGGPAGHARVLSRGFGGPPGPTRTAASRHGLVQLHGLDQDGARSATVDRLGSRAACLGRRTLRAAQSNPPRRLRARGSGPRGKITRVSGGASRLGRARRAHADPPARSERGRIVGIICEIGRRSGVRVPPATRHHSGHSRRCVAGVAEGSGRRSGLVDGPSESQGPLCPHDAGGRRETLRRGPDDARDPAGLRPHGRRAGDWWPVGPWT